MNTNQLISRFRIQEPEVAFLMYQIELRIPFVKLGQQFVELLFLPFLRAVHTENSLHPPYHSSVIHHLLVVALEKGPYINHFLGTNLQQFVIEGARCSVEIGINLVKIKTFAYIKSVLEVGLNY